MSGGGSPVGAEPVAGERTLPRLGGFSLAFLALEVRRLLRNRRTVFFTLALPPIFYLLFSSAPGAERLGHGNVAAYIMISLGVYGGMAASTSGGAMVSVERAAGWSRQLRLTPLRPAAYIAVKLLTAMVLGAASVAVVFAVGAATGAQLSAAGWVVAPLIAWVGSVVFAALGLFVGYLVPSENVMQVLGPMLALLAFGGGLFQPLSLLPAAFRGIAPFVPSYGVGVLARVPLLAPSTHTVLVALANTLGWVIAFSAGAAALYRRDTRRG